MCMWGTFELSGGNFFRSRGVGESGSLKLQMFPSHPHKHFIRNNNQFYMPGFTRRRPRPFPYACFTLAENLVAPRSLCLGYGAANF